MLFIESEEVDPSALTLDFSPYGLRLQTAAALTPGQPVEIVLGDKPGSIIDARVAWVGQVETDQAGQAGLEFLRPLTSQHLADG
jgi:hypothetical protein